MAEELLDLVNDNDEVIGQGLRSEIHAKGLLHREIGVYFVTPAEEIIFQVRDAFVEVNKHKVAPAVGGHVVAGDDYEETALREMEEETGVKTTMDHLHFLEKLLSDKKHPDVNIHNRNLRKLYGYVYRGNITDLKSEQGKGAGFVAWPIDAILNPTEEIRNRLLTHADPDRHPLYEKLRQLAKGKV